MHNRFVEIYDRNEWKHGSGEGSLPVHTGSYRSFLQSFLVRHAITSVVDMGCGDWQFSRLVDWGNADYRGFDVVPAVVARNTSLFATPTISFTHYSGNPDALPTADLILVKDVLQHLPNEAVFSFLQCLPKYRYALITNCINPKGATQNVDIALGGCRYLDLRLPPFNVNAQQVFSFQKNERSLMGKLKERIWGPVWKKIVLLVERDRQDQD